MTLGILINMSQLLYRNTVARDRTNILKEVYDRDNLPRRQDFEEANEEEF